VSRRLSLGAGLGLPPLVLFGWMLLGPETLGRDYTVFPPQGALTFRSYTAAGLEPLFYPHQTGGIPVGGLFFAQYFHFPAWLTSQLPGYWDGEALPWFTLRHLLLLVVAQGLHYAAWRRGIGLSSPAAYVISFLAVYNLRTLDNLRYGTAFEATVYAHAVVLLSVLHVLAPSRLLLALVVVAGQLLVTCGYPVVVPFAGLAALLLVPALLAAGCGAGLLVRRGGEACLAAALGALLAAPHALALWEWMAVNDRRVAGADLAWGTAWAMEPRGVLENLVYPWAAEVHSAFAGPSLLVVAGLVLFLVLARTRGRRAWLIVLALPLLYALGTATPVFPFFFERVPGFGFLRVPGRVLSVLPLLAFASALSMRGASPVALEERLRSALRPAAAGVLGLTLLGLALVALRPGSPWGGAATHEYCAASLSEFWSPVHRALWLAAGALAAGMVLFARRPRATAALVGLATVAQTGMLMRHGTWTEERPRTATLAEFAAADHLPLYGSAPLQASNFLLEGSDGTATIAYGRFLNTARRRANCYLPILPGLRDRGVVLPFYLSPSVACVRNTSEALGVLRAGASCRDTGALRTLVTDAACADEPPLALASGSALAALNEGNRLIALTPNLAAIDVKASTETVLVTPFPNVTANWRLFLDGSPVPLVEVNGGFVGARVPPGRHQVEVRYFSALVQAGYRAAFAGALAVVLVGGGRILVRRAASKWVRSAALLLLVAAGVLALVAYRVWETDFGERANRRILLHNSYPERLAEQLTRWRGR
jgi:succinate dehydrogenase hydrophobic anchor subunit